MSALTFDGAAAFQSRNACLPAGSPDALRVASAGNCFRSGSFAGKFVYWGGSSTRAAARRFIYAPAKLDPHAASWMANKFQSAMPGALLRNR